LFRGAFLSGTEISARPNTDLQLDPWLSRGMGFGVGRIHAT